MAIRPYTLKSAAPAPKLRIDYTAHLNDEQLAVVEAPPGPVLVIAGAGSGKTRTLTYRVARLLESGVRPESLLLLTFTNKAAREMLKRVAELCAGFTDTRRIIGGTFHHVGHLILRQHAELLNLSRGFTLIDREDARDLVQTCIGDLGFGAGSDVVRRRRFPRADLVVDLFSTVVNTSRPIADVLVERAPQFLPLAEEIGHVYERFMERKMKMQALDFDDLLLYWKLLMKDVPDARARIQERFRCVLVDEYQDTNRLQGDIVDLVAAAHKNLTVVGDDAQSIYSFRGADFTNIIEFPARYPDAKVFQLTVNYRSTPQILELANASIAVNRHQFKKELRAVRADGPRPTLCGLKDVYQQAEFVAQRLLELRDEGVPLKEMAVLYRAHHHSMEIQVELSRRGIPFIVRSGVRFFEQAHIKDVLAHLKFVQNPSDELSFKRVLRLYPGVGTAAAIAAWEAIAAATGPDTAEMLRRADLVTAVAPRARPGIAKARDALQRLCAPSLANAPGEMIVSVLETGYEDYLRAQFLNAQARVDDVRQLSTFAEQYPTVEDFLAEVSLLSEFNAEDPVEGREPDEYVTLSSVHQAKGLEWRIVFVVWLAEGRFPLALSLRTMEDEEEERRLFYVAATRAKEELYLSYPLTTAPRDSEKTLLRLSRFIDELPSGEKAPYDQLQITVEHTPQLEGVEPPRAITAATPSSEEA
jgi:DNA helicase II / ATP-dependent DNA helicase PcrA